MPTKLIPVYRYYNPQHDRHYYSTNPSKDYLTGWNFEGIKFFAVPPNSKEKDVNDYDQFYNRVDPSSHRFERNWVSAEWELEGPKFGTNSTMLYPRQAVLQQYVPGNSSPGNTKFFYTSNPSAENLNGLVKNKDLEYVYNPIPYQEIRFNQVKQKASHNSYQRLEGILDQVYYWNIRSLEFDLHRGVKSGSWSVYHDRLLFWERTNTYDLETVANLCLGINSLDPNHEVITVFLEIKNDGDFNSTHTPDQLDAILRNTLGQQLYTPLDMANGYISLTDAIQYKGWPRLADLRGKFIFVLNNYGRSTYCGNNTLDIIRNKRVCFFADTISDPKQIGKFDFGVFYNLDWDSRSLGKNVFSAGYVSRLYPTFSIGWTLDNADDWQAAENCNIHILATNKVNSAVDSWSSTCDMFWDGVGKQWYQWVFQPVQYGYPLVPQMPTYAGMTCSTNANISSMKFSYDICSQTPENNYQVAVFKPSHISGIARCGLMVRQSTSPKSPFFTVFRSAGDNYFTPANPSLAAKWRMDDGTLGIEYLNELGAPGQTTIPPSDCVFLRLELVNSGRTCRAYASLTGTANNWKLIMEKTFANPLCLQGIVCTSNGSDETVFTMYSLPSSKMPPCGTVVVIADSALKDVSIKDEL